MPALPFDPVDLAPAFPDVAWAIGIAFVLAIVTFRSPKPPTPEEMLAKMGFAPPDDDPVDDADDGS